MYQAKRYKR